MFRTKNCLTGNSIDQVNDLFGGENYIRTGLMFLITASEILCMRNKHIFIFCFHLIFTFFFCNDIPQVRAMLKPDLTRNA